MISFELSGDLAMFRDTARDLAAQKIRPQNRAAEEAGAIDPELEAQYVELGLAAVEIPEAYGGLGQGLVGRIVVEEELAFGDLGVALALPAPGPFAAALLALGTDAQKEKWIGKLIEEQKRGLVAWSELKPKPGTFSTKAEEQADGGWRINGVKSELVLADRAGAAVIFARAQTRSGHTMPAAFAIELSSNTPGVRFGARREGLGLNAAPAQELTLEDVHVPADARLSGADDRFDRAVLEMFARIAVTASARSVGIARAAVEYAKAYAQERQAFGKVIAHFQAIAFLVSDMATRVEVMRTCVQRAAWAFDQNEDDAAKLAFMALAEAHEGAMFVTNNAVQVLGGAGFIQDFPVEKWMRDAKAHMAYAMPHQACDLFVGRLALEGAAVRLEEDAPMPELQPVLI
jgi:alkylation response protein AidB-like acyl-CoA dehydrogenase